MNNDENADTDIMGRYYVYALIDPRTKIPFYIGKGEGNRAVDHFSTLAGLGSDEVFSQIESEELITNHKIEKISELLDEGYGRKDMVRVICRRVNRNVAFSIESCLITSVYGLDKLSNIQPGHHANRFRPTNNLDYIQSFDLAKSQNNRFLPDNDHKLGGFYVYVLIHPIDKTIFYIGKGKGNRLSQHFSDARDYNGSDDSNEKLSEISSLLKQDHNETDIGRIVARVDEETIAYMLETLYINFIVGYEELTNLQNGKNQGLFRAKGDWEPRKGFDIPIIVEFGEKREELLDLFLGAGLDVLLHKVKDKLCGYPDYKDIIFSSPKVEGAGELAIDCVIGDSITLRLQTRFARNFQVSLRARNNKQKIWMVKHFNKLNAFPYKRSDFWFFPIAWRGQVNVTSDIDVAVDRLKMMIKLVRSNSREVLPTELLDGLPYAREITQIESEILNRPLKN